MSRFDRRSEEMEIMDDLTAGGQVLEQTLREIDRINRWLGGNALTLSGMEELLNGRREAGLTVCDLGCGSGEMLMAMRRWGQRGGHSILCTGIDANAHVIDFARLHCASDTEIKLRCGDALDVSLAQERFHVVTATLFAHHLTDEQLVRGLKQWLHMARVGVIINDLHRHWFAYYAIRGLTVLFSKSAMVRFDAPLSVLRGFTRSELQRLLHEAGIIRYRIRWKWAFRWQIIIPAAVA
jgi:2-polyprenyl-3-methyl-5-hydroxy-6-metoxy-1,4-benzoquinol methylase